MRVGTGLAPPSVQGRPSVNRHPGRSVNLPGRIARGAVTALLYAVLAGGIATAVGSGLAYFKGRADGKLAAENVAAGERAAQETRHAAERDKLRSDAQKRFDDAIADAARRHDLIDTARKEAQRDLALEQATTRRLRYERDAAARAAADAGRVRDAALARSATGGTTEAADTLGACRARADALGRALGEVLGGAGELLRERAACSLDLEDAGGATRALLRWSAAVEASERAGPAIDSRP